MVTAALPRTGGFQTYIVRLKRLTSKITVPASLRSIAQMPFTVAGLGCIDTGVFTASRVAGWIVTGITLIGLEFLAADDS